MMSPGTASRISAGRNGERASRRSWPMMPELAVLATPTSGMLPRKASAEGGHAVALATTGSTDAAPDPTCAGGATGGWDGPLLAAGAREGLFAGAAFFAGASAGTTTAGSVVAD